MFNLHAEITKFFEQHIRLSKEIRNNLKSYKDTNIDRMKSGLDQLGYPHPTDIKNQGGYAMFTTNQHPENDYDIDIAIIFRKDDLPSSPLDARKRIEEAMLLGGGNFAKPPKARTNAVTIWYQEGHHVDLAIHRTNEYEIIEHAGTEWNKRDPQDITEWFTDSVSRQSPSKDNGATVQSGQMRRIVRYLKYFSKSRISWSLPGGLILSTLVDECYQPDIHRDDLSFYNTLTTIKSRLDNNLEVRNPVDYPNFLTYKKEYKNQVKRLLLRIDLILNKLNVLFSQECTFQNGMTAWYWVFRHDYWKIDLTTKSIQEIENKRNISTEQFGDLKITARLSDKENGKLKDYYPERGGHRLPYGIWIKFNLKSNIPNLQDFEVQWIVENFGDEAHEYEDLTHESNGFVNWEHTKYRGSHFMICQIVRNNQILARRIHIVKIK